jgi:hypothetical protein
MGEKSLLGSTYSEGLVPLATDGWQLVADSPLFFTRRVLPAQPGLKLAGGVLRMGGNLYTTKEGTSIKEKNRLALL